MGRNNLIVGARTLHNVTKAYVKTTTTITNFVKPNTPTNMLKNETILTQYYIKHGLHVFGKKGEATVSLKNGYSY